MQPESEIDRRFQRWYTQDVRHYDSRFEGSFGERESRFIVDLMRPRPGMSLLDIGTGTGRAALALASVEGAKVVGLDVTPAMLRQARSKRDALGSRYPLLVCGNARRLPFPDDAFDGVLSIRVLHLFPVNHWHGFIHEMTRVLKPGGVLLVEFDSALAGFGWGMVRDVSRHWTRDKSRYYLWPHQVEELFLGLEHPEVFGFWLPGIGRLSRTSPRFAWLMRFACLVPPFGFLGNHVLVRAQKPAAASLESTGALTGVVSFTAGEKHETVSQSAATVVRPAYTARE